MFRIIILPCSDLSRFYSFSVGGVCVGGFTGGWGFTGG